MLHYNNDGKLHSFESEEAMLKSFPGGLIKVSDDELALFTSPEETAGQKIEALEQSITPRMIRGAITGDQWAIDKILEVEEAISALRGEL